MILTVSIFFCRTEFFSEERVRNILMTRYFLMSNSRCLVPGAKVEVKEVRSVAAAANPRSRVPEQ